MKRGRTKCGTKIKHLKQKSRMQGWLIISGENILRFPMVMAEPLVDPAFDVFGPSPQQGHLVGKCDPPRR